MKGKNLLIILLCMSCGIWSIQCDKSESTKVILKHLSKAGEFAELREYDNSEREVKRAISIARKRYGANNYVEGSGYLKLIYIHLNQDKINDAESAFSIATNIFNDYVPDAEREKLKCLAGQASIYSYKEDYIQAKPLLERVINNYPLEKCKDSLFYYYSCNYLASILKAIGEYNRADSIFNLVIGNISQYHSDDLKYLVSAYLGLSSLAIKQNNPEESRRILDSLMYNFPELLEDKKYLLSTLYFHKSILDYRETRLNPDTSYTKAIDYLIDYNGASFSNIRQACKRLYVDFKFYGYSELAELYMDKREKIKCALDSGREPDKEDLDLLVDWTEYCTE